MKLTVSREHLLAALHHCASVVDRKAAHFAASAALLSTGAAGVLTVRATDCVAANIRVTLAGVDHDGPGDVAVSARDLLERVKAMPDGCRVTLEVKGEALHVTSPGHRRFTLRTLPASELPAWPKCGTDAVTLPGAAVASALGTVAHAMRVEADQAAQHAALLTYDGTTLKADATDSHRSAHADVPATGEDKASPLSMLLGFRSVGIVQRLVDGAESVSISKAGDVVLFRAGVVEFATLTVNAQFPPARQIAFSVLKPTATLELARAGLVDAVRAIALGSPKVMLTIDGDTLALEGVDTKSGEESGDRVPVVASGKADPVRFMCPNLLEALNAAPEDTLKIEAGPSELDPIRVRSSFATFVVMPVRA